MASVQRLALLINFQSTASKKTPFVEHWSKIQPQADINMTSPAPTLSYVPASLFPKERPSCADTTTLLMSDGDKKDSRVLASQSRLWGSGSLQQRSAATQAWQHYLSPAINAKIILYTCNYQNLLERNDLVCSRHPFRNSHVCTILISSTASH